MTRIGVITGLAAEATIFRRAARQHTGANAPVVACAGPGYQRAYAAARTVADTGVRGLVSFGIAGGLDRNLAPGDLLIAARVRIAGGDTIATDAAWRTAFGALLEQPITAHSADILSCEAPIAGIAEKAAAMRLHAVVAVDMESGGIAMAAREAGLPLLVIRAIADCAERSVPAAAMAGLTSDGRRRPFRVLGGLLRRPYEFPETWRLGRDSRAAFATLRRVVPRAAPGFGLRIERG